MRSLDDFSHETKKFSGLPYDSCRLERASLNKPYFTVNCGRCTGIRYLGL